MISQRSFIDLESDDKRDEHRVGDGYSQELIDVFNKDEDNQNEEDWANFQAHSSELETNNQDDQVEDKSSRARKLLGQRAKTLTRMFSVQQDDGGGEEDRGTDNNHQSRFDQVKEEDDEEEEEEVELEEEEEEVELEEEEVTHSLDVATSSHHDMLCSRLEVMEEEHEMLNNSLLALTSHFAQVQLRLRQIVESKEVSGEKRETLLMELEAFANRGIPELMLKMNASNTLERSQSMATSLMADDVFEDDNDDREENDDNHRERHSSRHDSSSTMLERQKTKQKELIEQLKEQLEDLERYAYETGELNGLPSSMVMERQNVFLEQIKTKLPVFSIEEIDKLSPEELRTKVDLAVKELVSPVLMKEQLVSQLKTQVTDLERFIQFLQQANPKQKQSRKNANTFAKMSQMFNVKRAKSSNDVAGSSVEAQDSSSNKSKTEEKCSAPQTSKSEQSGWRRSTSTESAFNIIKRIISLLHVFTWAQFAKFEPPNRTNQAHFERNVLKRTTDCGRHWGDLRAQFELAIDALLRLHRDKNLNDSDYTSDTDDACQFGVNYFDNEQIIALVRRDLAITLANLIQHGLAGNQHSLVSNGHGRRRQQQLVSLARPGAMTSLMSLGLGCFNTQYGDATLNTRPTHAWQLILYYYHIKNGSKFRSSPSQRLAQSFGLEASSSGGNMNHPKHTLLTAIDNIIDSHTRLKRSLDYHFKAFVCLALNQRMLSTWLRLILRNSSVVSECYEHWSYTASTGFEDALRQLDKLSSLHFCLPTNLQARHLQPINDAF